MRSYAAIAPAPVRAPGPPAPLPELVKPVPKKPGHDGWWWVVAVVFAVGAVFAYRFWQRPAESTGVPRVLRTSVIRRGPVRETIRLTGLTVAQKSATLLTPQMWGVRVHGTNDFTQVLQKLIPSGTHVR